MMVKQPLYEADPTLFQCWKHELGATQTTRITFSSRGFANILCMHVKNAYLSTFPSGQPSGRKETHDLVSNSRHHARRAHAPPPPSLEAGDGGHGNRYDTALGYRPAACCA